MTVYLFRKSAASLIACGFAPESLGDVRASIAVLGRQISVFLY